MSVQDHYRMVSSGVRIANATEQTHRVRLKALSQLIAEAFRSLTATIYLADDEGRYLKEKISTLLPDDSHGCRIPFGKGIAGRCANHARPLRRGITSLHPDEPFIGNERQIAAFPILDHDRVAAILTLGLQRNDPLDDRERDLLQTLLTISASVIRCMRQLEVTSKRLNELSFLHRISNAMLSTIKLNRLVHLILSSLTSESTPLFDRAMLFLLNERTGVLQGMTGLIGGTGADQGHSSAQDGAEIHDDAIEHLQESEFCKLVKATRLPLDRSKNIISRAVLDKQLIHVSAPRKEVPIDRSFIKRFGSLPFAVAPLIAQDRVVGAIVVDNHPSGRALDPCDLETLQLFANQAGMAIENSILFNRLEDSSRNLHDAQERLLQGEKLAAIGKMAAAIAHELKNPLVSVGGFAGRLKKRLPADSEEWEYADLITREVQHLESMLTDILFFSKKTTICYGRCSVNQIVSDALAVVAMTLEEKKIRIETQYASRLPSLLGDCQQLRHVFINLFCNAHEVMDEGGTLSIETRPGTLEGQNAVSVSVADTGSGISPEVIPSIFTPFFTTKDTGTGLGLAIAHKIITNHCGRIEVRNREDKGAEFIVTIPITPQFTPFQ